ncbi:hypothetical protein [Leptospira sp. GIMC2001]|uniref:hypothetical protein n=1 Tax=Leptospira sp. GIMC2001 TaxID=1513297 RepID=UPI00234B2260|nr:hypothetical protein [Leptospira sp. GIMC2001]WCL51485.1 hypothetical protein O4O04_19920 [Leptospira sp. GIMC2001]
MKLFKGSLLMNCYYRLTIPLSIAIISLLLAPAFNAIYLIFLQGVDSWKTNRIHKAKRIDKDFLIEDLEGENGQLNSSKKKIIENSKNLINKLLEIKNAEMDLKLGYSSNSLGVGSIVTISKAGKFVLITQENLTRKVAVVLWSQMGYSLINFKNLQVILQEGSSYDSFDPHDGSKRGYLDPQNGQIYIMETGVHESLVDIGYFSYNPNSGKYFYKSPSLINELVKDHLLEVELDKMLNT